VFKDSNLKATLIDNGVDTDGDGVISKDEAADVKSLVAMFGRDSLFVKSSFTSFDEFQYFTGIDTIPAGSFRNWTQLTSITLPESIKVIDMDFKTDEDNSIFRNCPKLTKIRGKFSNESQNALIYNSKLVKVVESETNFVIPSEIDTIVRFAFYNSYVQDLTIPANVKVIGESAFEFSKVDTVIFAVKSDKHSYLNKVGERSFAHCYNLIAFMGPEVPESHVRVTPNHRCLAVDTLLCAYTLGSTEANLTDLTDSWHLKRLSDYLFDVVDMDGKPLESFNFRLSTVALPITVNHIGEHTFRNQAKLCSIYFKSGVPPYYCGENAFEGCPEYDSGSLYQLNYWISYASDVDAFAAALHVSDKRIMRYETWPYK
jgi:hypothetical protein